jgi:ABC-type cobalamin transport system permease subunit
VLHAASRRDQRKRQRWRRHLLLLLLLLLLLQLLAPGLGQTEQAGGQACRQQNK